MVQTAKAPKTPKPGSLASKADRHRCYEEAVQCVESEIDFVEANYKRIRGKRASVLREDFCGTANTSCEWIRRRKTNKAVGVDLDEEVLGWGQENNVGGLNRHQQDRIELVREDVRSVGRNADVVLAMNFSYQIFKDRQGLCDYFRSVLATLNDNGILFIDAFGGYESYRAIKEKTKHKEFAYTWDQHEYDPITNEMLCYIHFSFKDGSKLKRAFSYEWRMYTLPELREILVDAGFKNVTVYWEGTDEETGEGNGEYLPATEGSDDPAWICYISAEK